MTTPTELHKIDLRPATRALSRNGSGRAAMSAVVERYVRAYPDQYMWSMKRFKKRPAGEARWY